MDIAYTCKYTAYKLSSSSMGRTEYLIIHFGYFKFVRFEVSTAVTMMIIISQKMIIIYFKFVESNVEDLR
jgi:hypothetical protein